MPWQERNGELYQKLEFKDFKAAFEFMKKVADVSENQKHHPRWLNEYGYVEIWLSTHSEGKITQKDYQLAKEIDRIWNENFKV